MSANILDASQTNWNVVSAPQLKAGAGGLSVSGGNITCSGQSAVGGASIGGNIAGNRLQLVQSKPTPAQTPAAVNPTSWEFYSTADGGGGLQADHLQIYGYFDANKTAQTIQEFADVYAATVVPTALGPPVVPASTTPVWRTTASVPLNWGPPFVGTTTGTGAPLVVPCVGIAAAAQVRFYLVGGSIAAFAAGIAAPAAVSVQPNVSFTYTGTTGAIYGYEVLQA